MGTKDFPPNGRCPCGSRLPSAQCHQLGPAQEAELEEATIRAMHVASVDPAIIYAYKRTHLIVTSEFRQAHVLDAAAELDEWDDAIMEYRENREGGSTNWIDLLRFEPLLDRLREIDTKLDALNFKISASSNPDGEGLLDVAEDLAGDGFIACQLYLIERMGEKVPNRPSALQCGPRLNKRFIAEIIQVAGNYRKHVGEWPSDPAKYKDQQNYVIAVFNDAAPTVIVASAQA